MPQLEKSRYGAIKTQHSQEKKKKKRPDSRLIKTLTKTDSCGANFIPGVVLFSE